MTTELSYLGKLSFQQFNEGKNYNPIKNCEWYKVKIMDKQNFWFKDVDYILSGPYMGHRTNFCYTHHKDSKNEQCVKCQLNWGYLIISDGRIIAYVPPTC